MPVWQLPLRGIDIIPAPKLAKSQDGCSTLQVFVRALGADMAAPLHVSSSDSEEDKHDDHDAGDKSDSCSSNNGSSGRRRRRRGGGEGGGSNDGTDDRHQQQSLVALRRAAGDDERESVDLLHRPSRRRPRRDSWKTPPRAFASASTVSATASTVTATASTAVAAAAAPAAADFVFANDAPSNGNSHGARGGVCETGRGGSDTGEKGDRSAIFMSVPNGVPRPISGVTLSKSASPPHMDGSMGNGGGSNRTCGAAGGCLGGWGFGRARGDGGEGRVSSESALSLVLAFLRRVLGSEVQEALAMRAGGEEEQDTGV